MKQRRAVHRHYTWTPHWHNAAVTPDAKPSKGHTNSISYRSIALTSCLCKIFEEKKSLKMLNLVLRKTQTEISNIKMAFANNMELLITLCDSNHVSMIVMFRNNMLLQSFFVLEIHMV